MKSLQLLAAAPLLVGCSVGFGQHVALDITAPVLLPDNLCDSVPDTLVSSWQLVETAHATTADLTRSVATCEMTGEVSGETATVTLSLESRSGEDPGAALAAMDTLRDAECGPLGAGSPWGSDFSHSATGCTLSHPGHRFLTVGSSPRAHGVAVVEVASTAPLRHVSPSAADLLAILVQDPAALPRDSVEA